jgi:hypothetical protein
MEHGFHFQHKNSRTFPIESIAHDSGRTLVCAEYGYQQLKKKSAATALNTALASAHTQ